MKLQPESKKELLRIACGVSLCTAVMWVVFAALHLVGWVVFDYRVLLGGIIALLARCLVQMIRSSDTQISRRDGDDK